jgi:hypothetical protein
LNGELLPQFPQFVEELLFGFFVIFHRATPTRTGKKRMSLPAAEVLPPVNRGQNALE